VKTLEIYLKTPAPNGLASARIVDKTGLTGLYDFKYEFAYGPAMALHFPASNGGPPAGTTSASDPGGGPDIPTALDQQVGLKLTKGKATFDVMAIDRVNRVPTDN